MAYHQDNQYFNSYKKKSHSLRYVLVLVLVVICFFVFRKSLKSFSYTIAVPALETGSMIERGLYSLVHSKSKLMNHIQSLEAENAELHTKLIDYSLLENENSGFKNSSAKDLNGTIATVIARPSSTPYDTLLIKTDFATNIGMNVYTISGIPLGTVTNVSGNNSTITLYSSPGNKVDADIILGDAMDAINASLRGRGGGAYEAITPKDVDIPIGSFVIIPSLTDKPMAEVVKIVERDDTKDQMVYFRSTVNFQYLRYVILAN